MDPHVDLFEEHRRLLFGVAYRMLGSVGDAEDMVQETWLRWITTDHATVDSPRSWLIRIASRLCLDRLKSAQVQRLEYFGTWLPDPFLEESSESPTAQVDESVSIALLLVLEKLSPEERAGFLLHEVFGYSFEEIAVILGKSNPTCRKLVSRARVRVRSEKPRFASTNGEHEELLRRFLDACRVGELEPLMELLAESVALHSDGGGKANAVSAVLTNPEEIARFFMNINFNRDLEVRGQKIDFTFFNGTPGILLYFNGQPISAMSLEVKTGKIAAIFGHRNPDKLREFAKLSDSSKTLPIQ